MDVSTIIQKLDQSKIPNVTPGKAKNLDEFFEMIIRPQFEKTTVINCIHHELLEYINLSAPTFFVRAHGSYPRDRYEFLRRGFLTRYSNGVEYAFCDNTFALLFATMRFSDQVIEAGDILKLFQSRKVQCGYGQTSPEKELAIFTTQGAFRSNLNAKGWYLAHIFPVGADYIGYNYRSDRNLLFSCGDRTDWYNAEKIRNTSHDPGLREISLLRAHFLRLCHPCNSFLVPKKSLLKYSNGSLIGEEPALIELVSKYLENSFSTEYEAFKKYALAGKVPEPFLTDITNINWGNTVDTSQAKRKSEPAAPKKVKREETAVDQVSTLSLLRRIGSEAFIYFFLPLRSDPGISTKNLVSNCPRHHNWTEKSKQSRASKSRRIFRENREKEALELIVTQNLDQNLIQLATRYLEELIEEHTNM